MILIYYINHCIEIERWAFQEKFYITIYYYLKYLVAVKFQWKNTCEMLEITFYTLPKIYGTRFVSHCGYSRFLHLWTALILHFYQYQNFIKESQVRRLSEKDVKYLHAIQICISNWHVGKNCARIKSVWEWQFANLWGFCTDSYHSRFFRRSDSKIFPLDSNMYFFDISFEDEDNT